MLQIINKKRAIHRQESQKAHSFLVPESYYTIRKCDPPQNTQ